MKLLSRSPLHSKEGSRHIEGTVHLVLTWESETGQKNKLYKCSSAPLEQKKTLATLKQEQMLKARQNNLPSSYPDFPRNPSHDAFREDDRGRNCTSSQNQAPGHPKNFLQF